MPIGRADSSQESAASWRNRTLEAGGVELGAQLARTEAIHTETYGRDAASHMTGG